MINRVIDTGVIAVFVSLMLTSCATKRVYNVNDVHFYELIESHKNNPQSISYEALWRAYLQSSQPEDSGTKYNKFLELKARVNSSELSCDYMELNNIVRQNYWSIKPHLLASDCARKNSNIEAANYHEDFVAFILEGVFSSGDGSNYYSAFEAASWGDVEDLLELANYKTIDVFLEFRGANRGAYYVVVAEDLETGIQENIYFDNIYFLNSAMGYRGRLGNREQSLGLSLAITLGTTNSIAAVAMADILVAENEGDLAFQWYLRSTLHESPIANMKLAKQCLKNKFKRVSRGTCLAFLADAAELELADAYVLLSALYAEGILVDKDKNLSEKFLKIAVSKMGAGRSFDVLGRFYQEGLLGEKNIDKANYFYSKAKEEGVISDYYLESLRKKLFSDDDKQEDLMVELKALADNNNEQASFLFGTKLFIDANVTQDKNQISNAVKYITSAANKKLPGAQYMMGKINELGLGVDKSGLESIRWYRKAANSWNAKAQYELARYFQDDVIDITDYPKRMTFLEIFKLKLIYAFDWMKNSASQGNKRAILSLGYFYEKGIGIKVDLESAVKLYKISADLGDSVGLFNYGYMLKSGQGIEKNLDEAYKYFLLSDEKGYSRATNNIGLMFAEGNPMEQNFEKAATWYLKAAKAGNKWAQFNLAECYFNGEGVERDVDEAITWFKKAAAQNHEQSIRMLKQLDASQ